MDFREYRITANDSGRRVDRVIRRFLPDLSLSGAYGAIRKGLVRVDGARVRADFRVSEGSILQIASPIADPSVSANVFQAVTGASDASSPLVDILLRTNDLLFVNKPAGIAVHGRNSLSDIVASSAPPERSLSFRVGPLHRLDGNTSGIIAFSQSLAGAQWFTQAIADHRVEKRYLGIALGSLPRAARWEDASTDGKTMITRAFPLARATVDGIGVTLACYRIETGRKHQIRMQSAARGVPLLGDDRYGGSAKSPKTQKRGAYYLHAWRLSFPTERPAGIPDELVAPLPPRFRDAIRSFFGEAVLARLETEGVYWSENDELQ